MSKYCLPPFSLVFQVGYLQNLPNNWEDERFMR